MKAIFGMAKVSVWTVWTVFAAVPTVSWAASAQVHGQGALVGEYSANMVPNSTTHQGFRFPFGLTLEGRASNNLNTLRPKV